MIYLNSRYLSKRLNINLAKWKRWSREFLDPDPLGGFQSGYARQFSFKDAFKVFLGGCLVNELNFTISEARLILNDLKSWLNKNKLTSWPPKHPRLSDQSNHIYVYDFGRGKFGYAIRTVTNGGDSTDAKTKEVYESEMIGMSPDLLARTKFTHSRVIYINALHQVFLAKLDWQ